MKKGRFPAGSPLGTVWIKKEVVTAVAIDSKQKQIEKHANAQWLFIVMSSHFKISAT